MIKIPQVKNVVVYGSSAIRGRLTLMAGLSSKINLRNKTSRMFNRKFTKASFYRRLKPNKLKGPGSKVRAQFFRGSSSSPSLPSTSSSPFSSQFARYSQLEMANIERITLKSSIISKKWTVLTGVTLALGIILLVSRTENGMLERGYGGEGEEGEEEDDGVVIVDQEGKAEERKEKRSSSSTGYQRIKVFDNNWILFCYSTLPLNAISRLWGKVNSWTLPMWLRPIGFRFYSFLFGVNLDEMLDPDLYHYANLSEFFYRRIKPEVRPVALGEDILTSPSDGEVLQIGMIDTETGEIEQVKGLTYSIKEFLGTHAHPLMCRSDSSLDLSNDKALAKKRDRFSSFAQQYSVPQEPSENHEDSEGNSRDEHYVEFKNEGDKTLPEEEVEHATESNSQKSQKLLSELARNIPRYRSADSDPSSKELYFAVIYLSPGDYHHFHSPTDWVCKARRHFPGHLYSVSPYFQHNFPNLFVLNERVALLGYWKHGFFSMTPVGATNVGSIVLDFDKELVTNTKRNRRIQPSICYEANYKTASKMLGGMPLLKGEEMGGFKLGSTVVLCFEAPRDFKFDVQVGDKVKLGQKLGEVL